MLAKVLESSLIVSWIVLNSKTLVVVAKVPSVQYIVLKRVIVIGERLKMMWSDEPSSFIFVWQSFLNILEIVVRWEVDLVRCRDFVIEQLITIVDESKFLVWVIAISFCINKEHLFGLSTIRRALCPDARPSTVTLPCEPKSNASRDASRECAGVFQRK